MCLFFAHIPFVVNHIINTTPLERLQQHPPPFCNEPHRSQVLCVKAELRRLNNLHILVTASFCCDRKSRVACAQSFALRQQATTDIMRRNLSYYCLLASSIYIFVLRAHPVRGESNNEHNTTGEVATVYSSVQTFLNVYDKLRLLTTLYLLCPADISHEESLRINCRFLSTWHIFWNQTSMNTHFNHLISCKSTTLRFPIEYH